jgi:hypothetical protein
MAGFKATCRRLNLLPSIWSAEAEVIATTVGGLQRAVMVAVALETEQPSVIESRTEYVPARSGLKHVYGLT